MWSGQAAALGRAMPAAELTRALAAEAQALLRGGCDLFRVTAAYCRTGRHISLRKAAAHGRTWSLAAVRDADQNSEAARFSPTPDGSTVACCSRPERPSDPPRFIAVLGMPLAALAQTVERPPSFAIEKGPGLLAVRRELHHQKSGAQRRALRIYTLTTPYGEFTAHGDQMLRMRVNELAALHVLEKIANSESYGKALVDAGLSPSNTPDA